MGKHPFSLPLPLPHPAKLAFPPLFPSLPSDPLPLNRCKLNTRNRQIGVFMKAKHARWSNRWKFGDMSNIGENSGSPSPSKITTNQCSYPNRPAGRQNRYKSYVILGETLMEEGKRFTLVLDIPPYLDKILCALAKIIVGVKLFKCD